MDHACYLSRRDGRVMPLGIERQTTIGRLAMYGSDWAGPISGAA